MLLSALFQAVNSRTLEHLATKEYFLWELEETKNGAKTEQILDLSALSAKKQGFK